MHLEVYRAAQSGDFDSLITIISGSGEGLLHQTTPNGSNILHVAAICKQVNFIEGVLQNPLGPSLLWQGNNNGDTPLHVAAEVGSYEVVRVFIDLAKSLHWDIENEQVDTYKELLRKQNMHKNMALHLAVRGHHDLVVELLIEQDSQLCDIINAADESPLYLAAEQGLSRTTELILGASSSSSSHKGPKGLTALHVGMSLSLTCWEKIMEKAPEAIIERDDVGRTPLHYFSYFGKVEAIRLLLQHNTSVAYDSDKEKQSALHIAAFRGHIQVIDELVRSCLDVCDMENTKKQTVLHAAVIGGQGNVVKHILGMPNRENLVNKQDADGNTALHLAALHKEYDIIHILAQDERVDRLTKNKDHLTALNIVSAHEETDVRAANVSSLLEGSHGILGFQGWFIEHGKKRSDGQFVEGESSLSLTTGSHNANRVNFNWSNKSIMEVEQVLAALIATVTFTAAFQIPGGYKGDGPDRGRAILAGRADFIVFVTSNSVAFLSSLLAVITQYQNFTVGHISLTVGGCLRVAIFGIVLAYVSGVYVAMDISTRGIADSIFDPISLVMVTSWLLVAGPRGVILLGSQLNWLIRNIGKLWLKCKTQLFDFPARLTSGRQGS
ncbi:hypothetical protein ACJRO7_018126 [Eucalyptus globulus]|uniref:PGG domain-containing protein n=1 Tax=Eucalyptus globulus TaxID=34317 RepID=A0ABD3KTM2_EUCGL